MGEVGGMQRHRRHRRHVNQPTPEPVGRGINITPPTTHREPPWRSSSISSSSEYLGLGASDPRQVGAPQWHLNFPSSFVAN